MEIYQVELFAIIFTSTLLPLKVLTAHDVNKGPYQPNWDSLESRPLPTWYDEAKFGIFMHWGLYSVPALKSEWFWYRWKDTHEEDLVEYMKNYFPPHFTYADFGPVFTADLFDPDHFADVIEASGAKYVVLTSKHHEGYTMYRSKYSWNWNSVDVGPARDLVGELADAIRRKTDVRFGLYYSLFEWFHPLFLKDQANNFLTNEYMKTVMRPQLMEIVNAYKPQIVWADGSGQAPINYWNSTDFLAWLYNDSPVKDEVVVNDRWGEGSICKHGGYYTCHDRFNPGVLQSHKWENAMTIQKGGWGYVRNKTLQQYHDAEYLIQTLVETVSCGGNLLMNFGPTHDGRIIPIFEERLRQMGDWLKVNGEGIYSSKPWRVQNDTYTSGVWYTTRESYVYCFFFEWPTDFTLELGSPIPSKLTSVFLLGYEKALKWTQGSGSDVTLSVTLPVLAPSQMPCQYVWVLKMANVS